MTASAIRTSVAITLIYSTALLLLTALTVAIFMLDPLRDVIPIYFYRGFSYLIIASLLGAPLLFALTVQLRSCLSSQLPLAHTFCSLVCAISLLCCFFTLCPLMLSRSYSMFLLGWMDDRSVPATAQDMAQAFESIYAQEHDLFGVRIREQIATGNFTELGTEPPTYVITEQGRDLVSFFNLIGRLFSVDLIYAPVPAGEGLEDSHHE